MSYLITCKKCKFQVVSKNPNRIKFCSYCGTFLKHEYSADIEQPFHLPEDSKNNDFPDGIIDNLMECSKILREISDKYLSVDDKSKDKARDNAIDQRLNRTPKDRVDLSALEDPRWFQKLKKLKF